MSARADEVKRIEAMTVSQLIGECEFVGTNWADIVGGRLPTSRYKRFYIDLSALVDVIAENRTKSDKAQALRPLIDEVRYSLMGQTVEDISRGLDGTLDLELNNLIDRIASHIVNMKMYRDGGV